MNLLRALFAAAYCANLLAPSSTAAQSLTRPERPWQTIATEHFDIHYPAEMRVWAEPVAQRMESVAAAVNALVGSAPRTRVTVVIEDPSNIANGFALPFLEGPLVFFWPTPPAPGLTLGTHRGWGEVLAVHEYGHIAHLTFPSRNRFDNFIWKFLPTKLGPVARKSPSWLIEGYATYIEGRLTGSGRPSSVGRAAVLRTWALDGKLPTYDQLNSSGPFLSGAMRYLAGSAFLEWLTVWKGDSSLTNLWRRMSARQPRCFAEAFRGVYGAYPDEMYGRFFVEVMADALEIDRQLKSEGLADGELLQHYRWAVGGPAVSSDGKLVAISVGSRGGPPRLEVWPTAAQPDDSSLIRQRARMLARDPVDVPAIDSFPPRRRTIATLRPSAGRSAESPRFFSDNERILVTRDEPLGDGATRPDLFIWNYKTGNLHRVTHGAAIRGADPDPDGKEAVGAQCLNGICGLVLVQLEDGRVRTLVAGGPDIVWNRPRFSPDGKTVAAGVQRDGHWQVAIVTVASGEVTLVEPSDGADRHSPVFTPDSRQLVVVSERGGISNLELLDLSGRTPRTVTRLTSAASAPDVSAADGRAYFLTLHARGYDVRRVALADAPSRAPIDLPAQLFPAAPRAPITRPAFSVAPVDGPHAYGIGPRQWRILPGGIVGAEGNMTTLAISNTDPIGRVGVLGAVGYGDRATWRGASLGIETRRTPLHIGTAGWYTEQRPSEQNAWPDAPTSFDATYVGAGGTVSYTREDAQWGATLRGGVSGGFLDGDRLDHDRRVLAVGEFAGRLSFGLGGVSVRTVGSILGAQGITAKDNWSLGLAHGTMTLSQRGGFLRFEAVAGQVTPSGGGEFGRSYEQFLVGGSTLPFADAGFQPNRVAVPGVPVGFVSGQRVALARIVLGGNVVEPSVTWVAAGDTRTAWKRVYAVERELAFPSLGFARLPAVRVRAGVSYSIDAPYEHKLRPSFSLVYRP